jgi:hypothetical protein
MIINIVPGIFKINKKITLEDHTLNRFQRLKMVKQMVKMGAVG